MYYLFFVYQNVKIIVKHSQIFFISDIYYCIDTIILSNKQVAKLIYSYAVDSVRTLLIDKNGFWFGLRLNVPVNNFSVMLGRSHHFLGIISLDTTRRSEWGSNPRPLDPESEVLTTRLPRPYQKRDIARKKISYRDLFSLTHQFVVFSFYAPLVWTLCTKEL